MMHVWVSKALDCAHHSATSAIQMNEHHAVFAALMPYQLPKAIAEIASHTDRDYFVKIGRGPGASPELYAAGTQRLADRSMGYLLSAGGTARPDNPDLIVRPITLMTSDPGATDLSDLVHLGRDDQRANNTGIIDRFAVARSPIRLPSTYSAIQTGTTWTVHFSPGGLMIATADTGLTAALYIAADNDTPDTLCDQLDSTVPAPALDAGTVTLPDGRSVVFDITSDADRWVVKSIDGVDQDRHVTEWPRLSGRMASSIA
jgi:hypothetical protein